MPSIKYIPSLIRLVKRFCFVFYFSTLTCSAIARQMNISWNVTCLLHFVILSWKGYFQWKIICLPLHDNLLGNLMWVLLFSFLFLWAECKFNQYCVKLKHSPWTAITTIVFRWWIGVWRFSFKLSIFRPCQVCLWSELLGNQAPFIKKDVGDPR